MLISKLGEFGLIERITKSIAHDASVIKGPGDDCAVLEFDRHYYQLFTCDMLVEGVDFTRTTDATLIGRKALGVSISDIAACGGIPRHAVVSLGLPRETHISKVDKIFKGMHDLARHYRVNIAGGDISKSKQLVIDVSMLGLVEKKRLVLRSGAKAGDIILASGSLGGSIKGKHLTFTPRVKEARFLVEGFKVNSMIDISDGLVQDLGHILHSSGVGAEIYGGLIPFSARAKNLCDALSSGEEFELLFTMPAKEAERLLESCSKFYRPIGRIVHKRLGLKLIGEDGEKISLNAAGYRHF